MNAAATPAPTYNRIFEQLVVGDDDIPGMIAYAIYKKSKREWILRFERDEGRPPGAEEIFRAYVRSQGELELKRLRREATDALLSYMEIVVDRQRPEIEAQALRTAQVEEARALHQRIDLNTRWYKGVTAGVVAALVYSALLIAAVVVSGRLGIDVLGAFERARSPGG